MLETLKTMLLDNYAMFMEIVGVGIMTKISTQLCLVSEALKDAFPNALLIRGADDHFIVIDAFESETQIDRTIQETDQRIQQRAEGKTSGIKVGACVYQEDMTTVVAMDHARDAIKWLGNDLNRVCSFYTRMVEDHDWNQRYIIDGRARRTLWSGRFTTSNTTLRRFARGRCIGACAPTGKKPGRITASCVVPEAAKRSSSCLRKRSYRIRFRKK